MSLLLAMTKEAQGRIDQLAEEFIRARKVRKSIPQMWRKSAIYRL